MMAKAAYTPGIVLSALIIGCGDTGTRIALALQAAGVAAIGVVRSADSAQRLRTLGIEALEANLDTELTTLPKADLVFYCAPPPTHGDDDPRLVQVLGALQSQPRHLVYISTSGVYGDCGGAWIDESTPLNPQTGRARRRASAEVHLAAWGTPVSVLRAPAIYGPGRLPLAQVRACAPVLADAESSWRNRIHVQDLAECALAAARHADKIEAPRFTVYNAADGRPTKAGALARALASRLGLPAPPEITWDQAQREWSAAKLSFLRESRRLDNRQLLAMLGRGLRYPDLDAGLAASL